MVKCCVCGIENSTPDVIYDEDMLYYCDNCYLTENSSAIDNE